MGGCCSDVQQQIRTFAPQAFYIHCYAHCLNLALVDCSKSVSLAWEFFALIQTLYTFISTYSTFVKVQKIATQTNKYINYKDYVIQDGLASRVLYMQYVQHLIRC